MKIADELTAYSNRWHDLTGHWPSAIPISSDEVKRLVKESMGMIVIKCVDEASPVVPTYGNADLYITPDAAERRAQILEKK